MINRLKALVCVTVVVAAASQASAGILYFEDFTLGTSAVPGAITLLGLGGVTTTVTDSASFNAALTGGPWDLVIFAEQNTATFPLSATELTAYVTGGGRVLGTTWLTGGLDALLEGSASSVNDSSIGTSGHPIFAGVGPTISLTNPGWGVFSRSWNPTGGATGLGTLGTGSAVILGNGGRTLLNGPLFDTFTTQAQGELFVANEIGYLLGVSAVPLPAANLMGLVALGGIGAFGAFRRRRRS